MAKRKRLTPPQPVRDPSPLPGPGTLADRAPETKSVTRSALPPVGAFPRASRWGMGGPAPIAQVAGDAAATAALSEVTEALRTAREDGRLVQHLALDAVDEAYLVRDRLGAEPEAMTSLIDSLRARGQQTPIEVVDLGGGRFGLISGWRRLAALRQLFRDTGEARFGTVLAVLRRPADSSDAYIAMVEENEIRVGLSYYERARIVVRAAEAGVFAGEDEALKALFGSASRTRRSKIGGFVRLYHGLDGHLSHPAAIPERLGLALVRLLDDGGAVRLRDRLRKAAPDSAEAELAVLERAVSGPAGKVSGKASETAAGRAPGAGQGVAAGADAPPAACPGSGPETGPDSGAGAIRVETLAPGHVVLRGAGIDEAFHRRLLAWLATAAGAEP